MRVAVIGGIGSGKSEVLRIAKEMGANTLGADEVNAQLLENDGYIREVESAFEGVVANGRIDRKKLADIVFSDPDALKKLNALAHPRILERISNDRRDPLIVEMPLLFEIGAQSLFDEIVLVYCPLDIRLFRLQARGLAPEQALARIKNQASEDDLKSIATRIIDNSSDMTALSQRARAVFADLLKG